jgi:tetratricopeptide (TPR) repeat protein
MLVRILFLFAFVLLSPLVSWGQEEEEETEALPLRVWHCLADWSIGDTMYYEVLLLDRSYQNETITAKKESSTRIRVSVVDSSEAGYLLNWQWLISDPKELNGSGLADTNLVELAKAMSTLEMTVRTGSNGSLISVDDLEHSIDAFLKNFEHFFKKYENEIDSAMNAEVVQMLAVFQQNKVALATSLLSNIELFFSPFGYEVLSDSFYVSPFEIRNAFSGDLIAGNIRVELKDVNEFSYQFEAIFDPDIEAFTKQIREVMNKQQKANKARRYSSKDVRSFGLAVQREERFVIHTTSGWPKHIHSVIRTTGKGSRREIERTVTSDVYVGRQKNELHFDEMITADPSDPKNYFERANIRGDRGDLAGAEEDLTMAYDLEPGKIVLRQRAWVRHELLKFEEALEDIDAALRIDSMDVYSINLRTSILFHLHHYAEALANAERSMRILPNEPYSMRQAGKLMVAQYKYPEAIAIYSDILARDSSDWTTLGLRADAYKYLRTFTGDSLAQVDIEHSLAIRPENYSALITLGNMHLDRGDLAASIKVFDVILAKNEDVTALHNRGYAKVQLGALDDGIKDLEDALDLEPGHAYGPNNLGWAYHLRGEHAKALQWIDKGIARQPTNSYAFFNKGRVLLAMGKLEEACEALHEADRLGFTKGYGNMVQELREKHCSP